MLNLTRTVGHVFFTFTFGSASLFVPFSPGHPFMASEDIACHPTPFHSPNCFYFCLFDKL